MYVNICHHVYIYIYIYTDGEELSPEQIGYINIYGQAYDDKSKELSITEEEVYI
jgi:hypothetical protein